MRHINKAVEEPPELAEYKRTPGVNYRGAPKVVKDAIRRDGLRDQYGVCCYCCGPLPREVHLQQIEHLVAQSVDSTRTLDWSNLLISCSSGRPELEPARRSEYTCDDRKADNPLPISPLDPDCEAHFLYVRETGAVLAHENDVDSERTISVLNLDCLRLRRGRLAAMDEAQSFLEALPRKDWLRRFTMPVSGQLTPYEPSIRSLLNENPM